MVAYLNRFAGNTNQRAAGFHALIMSVRGVPYPWAGLLVSLLISVPDCDELRHEGSPAEVQDIPALANGVPHLRYTPIHVWPNRSIKRTFQSLLRSLWPAAHVKR